MGQNEWADRGAVLAYGNVIYGGDLTLPVIGVGTNHGVFFSKDEGTTWGRRVEQADGFGGYGLTDSNVLTLGISPYESIFAGTSTGGLFRSTNNGLQWNSMNTGGAVPNVRSFAGMGWNSMYHETVFVGSDSGVYRRSDTATTWVAVNSGLPRGPVYAMVASQTLVYAAMDSGIYSSADSGSHWVKTNSGLPSGNPVRTLVRSNADLYGAVPGHGVFRSSTGGTSWAAVNVGLTQLGVHSLAAFGETVFAGTDSGNIFVSTNKGGSWIASNIGLSGLRIKSLALFGYGQVPQSLLFAATDSGIWRRPVSEMVTSLNGKTETTPLRFSLVGDAVLTIRVDRSTRVALEAFTPDGRRVATLLNEHLQVGRHTRHLNISTLSNGLYFFRIQAGGVAETRKVVLSR